MAKLIERTQEEGMYTARYTDDTKLLEIVAQTFPGNMFANIKITNETGSTDELILRDGKVESYLVSIGGSGNSWDFVGKKKQRFSEEIEEFKKSFEPLSRQDRFMKQHPEYFRGLLEYD